MSSLTRSPLSHPTGHCLDSPPKNSTKLLRPQHKSYLLASLPSLPRWFVSLDASKPWIVYWLLHSLSLLGVEIPEEVGRRAVRVLKGCWSDGGFGGGVGQIPHVATTYAGVNALAIVGTEEAYDLVDRQALLAFLLRLKHKDGSYTMHEGGEVDVRGIYCALATAKLVGILTSELYEGSAAFIHRCQTYEGGIGGAPGYEAHGGYTFCAVAALELIDQLEILDLDLLTHWLVSRQLPLEGGFQGRTNKLVDGCYSFWQGGAFPILETALARRSEKRGGARVDIFNRERLQEYILACCQNRKGGLRDKPEKYPDYYHTCYVLSGLSLAQHSYAWDEKEDDIVVQGANVVVGVKENLLQSTHPIHNILPRRVARIKAHFASLPVVE
ncbi:farnesyltransferase, CAAX box, beta [Fimicolochytrium jonesii]|uniref:farnesyltransferase, CAAX box, beta n=1 Tax=Fimicolochytrium jonesii TaxID=1396493 RepID=UPI0022FE99D6|nr:farnesyltransferase, CAAX box, beta [Fimicolochytrium jonesii]KAI8824838.1 farnesyltransferase, CAAX box, beta [Fimicolochytrium jonesii]